MSIAITAGSTIDLPQSLLDKYGIKITHFRLEKGGESLLDNAMTVREMFDYTEKTKVMCHTAAPNIGDFEELFAEELKTHPEGVINFSMSSGLSCCHQNAMAAAAGNPLIRCVDVHGTSGAVALLALWARKLIDEGHTLDEVYESCCKRNESVECSFIISELDYLYKGGRCSKLALIGANILKLRPVIVTDHDGKFATGKKYRGPIEKCILSYVQDTIDQYKETLDKSKVFFNYSWLADPTIIDKCTDIAKKAGFREVIVTEASPTNGYHAGPNVLGIQFLYDGEHDA